MLARCVNPACQAVLHSFGDGRIFQFEIVSISISVSEDDFHEEPQRQMVHFWLCTQCAADMTLILEPQHGLKLVNLRNKECVIGGIPDFADLERGTSKSHH